MNTVIGTGQTQETSKGIGKRSDSRTLLESLARAIDGTDAVEASRLADEFNNSFGHLVRASVDAESIREGGEEQTAAKSSKRRTRGGKKTDREMGETEPL